MTRKRSGVSAVVLVVVTFVTGWMLVASRSSSGQSPDDWRQLSLADFVRVMTELTSGEEPLSDALWTEIRGQAAERLLPVVAAGTAADYGDLVSLFLWARPVLTADQVTTVLAGLQPPANQLAGWTWDKLRAVHARLTDAELPPATAQRLVLAWLEGRDVRTLVDAEPLGWLLGQVQASLQTAAAPGELSVRWTGTLQAPADGQYVLSISPLNLDFQQGGAFRRQTTSIWVAEQQVLDSAVAGGTFRTPPVRLLAAQRTPLRVQFTYACSDPAVFADRPAVAVLFWEGPGMDQRVVPGAALSTGDGQPAGLLGEYTLRGAAGEESQRRVDPQINFIWPAGQAVLGAAHQLPTQLAQQLHSVISDPSTLSTWESAGTARQADWVGASRPLLESLSREQRQAWAATLLAHPALLADCTRASAANLYHHGRLGSPQLALEVWGTWAQAQAEEVPRLSADFYATHRQAYRELGDAILWEYPAHVAQLEQDYLVLADGGCALPVAYALSYAYWGQAQMGAWIEKLDARLADAQLSGDRRVGWLLARAQAEEIRRGPAGRDWRTMDRFLAGQGWIEEATLVATSEDARLRAFLELAARTAVDERLVAAQQILDHAQQRCTSAASLATLAQWRGALDALSREFQERHRQAEANARLAYVAQLRQRHEAARARGDTEAVTHYEQLLEAAGTNK
jgi:hypothetical protein